LLNPSTDAPDEVMDSAPETEKSVEKAVDVVEVEKSDDMIKLEKTLADQSAIIEEFTKVAIEKKLADKLEVLKNIPGDKEDLKEILKKSDDKVFELLKTIDNELSNSEIFKTKSVSGEADLSTNTVKLDKMAKEYSETNKVSYAKAYTKVLSDNPELYEGNK